MTGPLGTADFFALEAGELLDRLETLASRGDGIAADDLLRTTRAFRGSALMANRAHIARTAAAMELLARAVRDQRRAWDAAAREHLLIAVEECRLMVRRGAEASGADGARAERLAHDLEQLAGPRAAEAAPRSAAGRTAGDPGAGVRAFVARECTLVAGALERAARGARTAPGEREPLYDVLRRMQSLRGLAELGELTPLPELLDGLELALGDLTRLFAPPPEVPALLEAAARALTRVAREVAEDGRPTADAPEAREFTDLLLRTFAAESDVVPIETLFVTGDPSPIQRGALQPAFEPPGPLGAIELLSHGEHLYQSADQIERARSRTERDLRLYALVAPLRSLATAGASPLQPGLVRFADAARAHIAAGAATDRPGLFVDLLREAGALLRAAAGRQPPEETVGRLGAIAERLKAPATSPEAEPEQTSEPEVVPIQALAYTGEPLIVEWGDPHAAPAAVREPAAPEPAEAAEVAEAPAVVPIESLAPTSDDAPGAFEASWAAYERLARTDTAAPEPVPAAPPPAAEPAPEPDPEPELLVVDIESLLYRGRRALERAAEVRTALAETLRTTGSLESARPLIDELVDLVPLALDAER